MRQIAHAFTSAVSRAAKQTLNCNISELRLSCHDFRHHERLTEKPTCYWRVLWMLPERKHCVIFLVEKLRIPDVSGQGSVYLSTIVMRLFRHWPFFLQNVWNLWLGVLRSSNLQDRIPLFVFLEFGIRSARCTDGRSKHRTQPNDRDHVHKNQIQQGIHRHQTPPRCRNAADGDRSADLAHYGQTWRHAKPEVHKVSQRRRRRTEPRQRGFAHKISWRSVQCSQRYARGQTDTQTHKLITILRSHTWAE